MVTAKCTFSLTVKKASLNSTSGKVDLGIAIDMDTGTFDESVEVDLD